MGVANTSPPLLPLTSQHVLACISTLGWACCCAAETCDIGRSGLCHPASAPPVVLKNTHLTATFLTLRPPTLHPSILGLPFAEAQGQTPCEPGWQVLRF